MKIGGTLERGVENRMSTAMEKSSKNCMADRVRWRSLRFLAIFKIFLSSPNSLRKITKIVELTSSDSNISFRHKKKLPFGEPFFNGGAGDAGEELNRNFLKCLLAWLHRLFYLHRKFRNLSSGGRMMQFSKYVNS